MERYQVGPHRSAGRIVKRTKAHAVMAKVDRGVSQWAIVLATPTGTPGQYTVSGTSGAPSFTLDTVPFGSFSVQVGY